jgi:hypothetical protein
MSRYIARTCPKCRDYFGVVVNQQPTIDGEHPINAYCALCAYRLNDWRLIVGRKQKFKLYYGRTPRIFR